MTPFARKSKCYEEWLIAMNAWKQLENPDKDDFVTLIKRRDALEKMNLKYKLYLSAEKSCARYFAECKKKNEKARRR